MTNEQIPANQMPMPAQPEPDALLIVDDERVNRALLAGVFSDRRIVEAENGEQALSILRRDPGIAAVILDIIMPVMDGYEMLEAMRSEPGLSHVPVVVVTTENGDESQIRALDLGAQDILSKPYNPSIVRRRVENVVRRREADRLTEQNRLYERLLCVSETDEKTGIWNKAAFCRHTSELLLAAPDRQYVICRWDVDRFKVYNDRFGVEAGDRLLAAIGRAYREYPKGQILTYGHLDADHFVACFERDTFLDSDILGKLTAFVEELSPEFGLTCRAGVYAVEDPALDVSLMCDRALLALRSVKDNYARHAAWYDESMRASLLEKQLLTDNLERALDEGQFLLYIQPQYDYGSGALCGAEALVRWQHPSNGLMAPGRFIPSFERSGFICRLDEYIWEQVCILQRNWRNAGQPGIPISVNISRIDIANGRLCDKLCGLLERYGVDRGMLRLEITESAYMDNPAQLLQVVDRLHALGFHVEMDDFGSGYSSLNTLKEVPVDLLKLDMKFIKPGRSGSRSGRILSSVIRMADWLDMPVLAEGVETKNQADYLKSLGCVRMQGYYFAKPMPVAEFEALLEKTPVQQGRSESPDGHAAGQLEFLDASAQATLMFNSFVGGAQIVEYDGTNVEVVRVNERFFEVIGCTREQFFRWKMGKLQHFFPDSRRLLLETLERARDSGAEAECETRFWMSEPDDDRHWTRNRVRFLAKKGSRMLFYLAVENISEQKLLEETRAQLDEMLRKTPLSVGLGGAELSRETTRAFPPETQSAAPTDERGAAPDAVASHGAVPGPYEPSVVAQIFRYLYETADTGEAVQNVLQLLGRHFGVSRVYIYEDDERGLNRTMTFEWRAEGAADPVRGLADDAYRGLLQTENVFLCPDVAALPEPARERLERRGIRSLIQCAVMDEGKPVGFIGFDDCTGTMAWSERVVGTLSLCAMIVGAFLTKRRKQESAAMSRDYLAALDSSASFIYIVEPETWRVIYTNRAMRERFGAFGASAPCYREAVGGSAPCENCPAVSLERDGVSRPAVIHRRDGLCILSQASDVRWNGRRMYMITCTDVTEQKRIESELLERNREYAALVRQSGKKIIRYDLVSGAADAVYGSEELFGGQSRLEDFPEALLRSGVVDAESAETFRDFFAAMRAGTPGGSCDLLVHTASGETRWDRAEYSLICGGDERPTHSIIAYYDNTVAREQELAYRKWKTGLLVLLPESSVYLEVNLTCDRIEREEDKDGENTERAGQSFSQYIVDSCHNITFEEDREKYLEFFERKRLFGLFNAGRKSDHFKFRAILEDGPQWLRTELQMARYPNSDEVVAFVVYTNIDAEERERASIAAAASQDAMTGLLNRSVMQRSVNKALSAAQPGDRFALFMIDLDNFKSINDTLGHMQGDETLIRVAAAIRRVFRSEDLLCRFGGDEFMVFMRGGVTADAVRSKAEALLESLQFSIDDLVTSASVGAVLSEGDIKDFASLYNLADQALYKAKRSGKNAYELWDGKAVPIRRESVAVSADAVQLQMLLRCMDGGIVMGAVDGDQIEVSYVSPSLAADILSIDRGFPKKGDLFSLVYPPDVNDLRAGLLAAAYGGKSMDLAFRVGADGAMWRRLRGERQEESRDGRPRLLGVLSDITDLKQAERLVRESESLRRNSRYTAALAALFDEVYELDWQRGTITIRYSRLAPAQNRDVPMPLTAVVDRWLRLVPDEAERAALRAAVEAGPVGLAQESRVIRYAARTREGELRPLTATFMPLDEKRSLLCNTDARRADD